MNKETIYIDAVTKLNEQDAVIKELAELLSNVLTDYVPENHKIYVKATDYLKGLGYE
jgi:hypothetical protein